MTALLIFLSFHHPSAPLPPQVRRGLGITPD
jgi:hypothetical protein